MWIWGKGKHSNSTVTDVVIFSNSKLGWCPKEGYVDDIQGKGELSLGY